MTEAEFCREIDGILELAPGTVKPADALASLPGWDSMAVLSVIAMADEKMGVNVQGAAINRCETVADLAALCGAHAR